MLRRLAAATAAALVVVSLWPLVGAGPEAGAAEFLRTYVTDHGRVTRPDQGGDTVSEGQAYAMRIALDDGDRPRFLRIWRWTREHLQRDDGLFAWRWRDGAVADREPAADADVDIAATLADAARKLERPRLRREAVRIARAVLELETIEDNGRLLLAAGPWAVGPQVVNPSYSTLCGFRTLERATGDPRWAQLVHDFVTTLTQLLREVRLPPDWAIVRDGALHPSSAPGTDDAPRYGLDAQRVAMRAAPCGKQGRDLARRLWPRLRSLPRRGGAVAYSLTGERVSDARHPVGLLGAASAASAAGEHRRSSALVRRAQRWHHRSTTYYGAAWLALVRREIHADGAGEHRAAPARPVLVAARLPSGEPPSPTTRPTSPPKPPPTTASTTTTTAPTTTTTRATTTTTRATTTTTRSTSTTRRPPRPRPAPPGRVPPPAAGPTRPPATERSRRAPPSPDAPAVPPTTSTRDSARTTEPPAPEPGPLGPVPAADFVPSGRERPDEARAQVRFRQVSALVAGSVGLTVIAGTALGLYERARIRREPDAPG